MWHAVSAPSGFINTSPQWLRAPSRTHRPGGGFRGWIRAWACALSVRGSGGVEMLKSRDKSSRFPAVCGTFPRPATNDHFSPEYVRRIIYTLFIFVLFESLFGFARVCVYFIFFNLHWTVCVKCVRCGGYSWLSSGCVVIR